MFSVLVKGSSIFHQIWVIEIARVFFTEKNCICSGRFKKQGHHFYIFKLLSCCSYEFKLLLTNNMKEDNVIDVKPEWSIKRCEFTLELDQNLAPQRTNYWRLLMVLLVVKIIYAVVAVVVVQLLNCLTLCYTMGCSTGCSTRGLLVLHHFLEFTQVHVHWIGDGIQPSHLFILLFSSHKLYFVVEDEQLIPLSYLQIKVVQ